MRTAFARLNVLLPVILVAAVLTNLVASRLEVYHGNPAGFVLFGHQFLAYTQPPPGAPVESPTGFDGQMYWLQATDPLLLHHSTVSDLQVAESGYRFQRPAYPLIAYVLAGGQRAALPWTMLATNILAVLAATLGFSLYARRRGWSPWWALVVGLAPGLLMPVLRDLSDVLATTTMLGGLLAWRAGRRWTAGALLAVASLSREPMTLAVVAVAGEQVWLWWGARHKRGAFAAALRRAAPTVLLPAITFVAWQLYIRVHLGTLNNVTGPPVLPFKGYVDEIRLDLSGRVPQIVATWDLAYVALMIAGTLFALALLRRHGFRAPVLAACLFAVTVAIVPLGDQWSDTRYSAPMFLTLLVAGLELRSRRVLTTCAAVTALTVLLPAVITGY